MSDFIDRDLLAPTNFPFPEKIARQKAGLSEEDMRALRNSKLKLDVDFRYYKKSIFLSEAALKKIAPSLEARPEEKSTAGPIPAQAGPIAATAHKLLIVRTDLANRHILLCCPDGQDPDRPKKTVRVRVRSTEGFRIRTPVEGTLVPGYDDLYDLVSRYPRKKQTL